MNITTHIHVCVRTSISNNEKQKKSSTIVTVQIVVSQSFGHRKNDRSIIRILRRNGYLFATQLQNQCKTLNLTLVYKYLHFYNDINFKKLTKAFEKSTEFHMKFINVILLLLKSF